MLVVTLLARQLPEPRRSRGLGFRWLRVLDGWQAPLLIAVLTGLATWFVWGSLVRTPVVHDESAYLLQAQLFARFRFTAPSPPLPQFFEQLYVNLRPAVFSKYPPGTSLLLAPGVLVKLPGLPVVVMNALSGALVFLLARRFAGGVVALLTWLFWSTSFPVQYFHAMYLSEVPSSLAWLGTWWGVARWAKSGRVRDLAIVGRDEELIVLRTPTVFVVPALKQRARNRGPT